MRRHGSICQLLRGNVELFGMLNFVLRIRELTTVVDIEDHQYRSHYLDGVKMEEVAQMVSVGPHWMAVE